jgi:hypothetical protein
MVMKYDTRSCTVSQNWEWVQVSGSGGSKTVTKSGVSISILQEFAWDGGGWSTVGSAYASTSDQTYSYSDAEGYSGDIPLQSFSGSVSPPTTSGTKIDQRVTISGGATATYSGSVTKTSSQQWGTSGSSTHNASNSITYDDGTYAGTLYLDSVSGSPSSPSFNGSFIGQTTSTSTSGIASYSGDVPLKGGGDPDPTPTLQVVAKNITDTSVTAVIEGLMFEANYYHMFEMELWNGNGTTHIITESWADPSSNKYTSVGFNLLEPNKTYTLKGFTKSTPTGGRNHVGTVTFTTIQPSNTRPNNWSWTTLTPSTVSYTSGKLRANLVSASEWNSFCVRINDFRKFKNLATITFVSATSSNDFNEDMYTQAYNAISAMKSVNKPSGFYSKLIALSDALNTIN